MCFGGVWNHLFSFLAVRITGSLEPSAFWLLFWRELSLEITLSWAMLCSQVPGRISALCSPVASASHGLYIPRVQDAIRGNGDNHRVSNGLKMDKKTAQRAKAVIRRMRSDISKHLIRSAYLSLLKNSCLTFVICEWMLSSNQQVGNRC